MEGRQRMLYPEAESFGNAYHELRYAKPAAVFDFYFNKW